MWLISNISSQILLVQQEFGLTKQVTFDFQQNVSDSRQDVDGTQSWVFAQQSL